MSTLQTNVNPKGKIFTKKRLFWFATIIVVLMISTIIAISVYVGLSLVKPERKVIEKTPSDFEMPVYEEVTFHSKSDQTLLRGWWIPAQKQGEQIESNKALVFAHGYRDTRAQEGIEVLDFARRMSANGYDLLLFDFRRSGQSEGEIVGIGYYEKDDLLAAFDFVYEEKGVEDIAVIGWSMGSVTAILAGIESEHITQMIADSPFANLRDYLSVNLPVWSDLPHFPFTSIIIALMTPISGIELDEVSPYQKVQQLGDKDLFLIHSQADDKIPYENSLLIAENAKGNVDLWLTDHSGHIRSFQDLPDEYERRVLDFLQK